MILVVGLILIKLKQKYELHTTRHIPQNTILWNIDFSLMLPGRVRELSSKA